MRLKDNAFHISVTELARLGEYGTTASGLPFMGMERAAAGRKAQQVYQRGLLAEIDNYETEVSLFYRDKTPHFEIFLGGRLDGRYWQGKKLFVDEVKSIIRHPKHFPGVATEVFQHYRNQLALYKLLMAQDFPEADIEARLVFVNLVDGSVLIQKLDLSVAECAEIYRDKTNLLISAYQRSLDRQDQLRRAYDSLQWPYNEIRASQRQVMEDIRSTLRDKSNQLIEAPTGTGKTIAAVFPVVGDIMQNAGKAFYLTAKNTQQTLVLDTLEDIFGASSPIKILQMRSARDMCANDTFFCNDQVCPFAAEIGEKLIQSRLLESLHQEQVLLPELIFEKAKSAMICPAEVMLMMVREADFIVADYNYAFHPQAYLKSVFNDDYSDYTVIIDEAHNLPARIRQSYSPGLSLAAIREIKKSIGPEKARAVQKMRTQFDQLEQILAQLFAESELYETQTEYRFTEINVNLFNDWQSEFEIRYFDYVLHRIKKKPRWQNNPVDDFYPEFRTFYSVLNNFSKGIYRILDTTTGKKLQLYCADSRPVVKDRMNGFRSVIAMSATLKPFYFFTEALGLGPKQTRQTDAEPVFPRDHLLVTVMDDIDTTFRRRLAFVLPMVERIKMVMAENRGNYIVFFPSFDFLEMTWAWLSPEGYEKIRQKRTSTPADRAGVMAQMQSTDPHKILFAVMGGIYSEGIDFKGDLAIGAFIVSPGIPVFDFYSELQQHHFNEQNQPGYEYTYLYPAMVKVIQSAGRIIRAMTDRGIVVLIGKRFLEDRYQELMPESWFEKGQLRILDAKCRIIASFWAGFEPADAPQRQAYID
jgi:DNA excision repair protein ERCC-2